MSNDEFLMEVINSYKQSVLFSGDEDRAFDELKYVVNSWYNELRKKNSKAYFITMEIKRSGSREKGTAIKGKSDMDMFVSISDTNGYFMLRELYGDLYDYLQKDGLKVRKQNVSIGVVFKGYDIDVVPARKVNSSSYVKQAIRYNDHYLWSNKKDNRMLTNIQKHIDLVRESGIQNIIILLKIWKYQKQIDFPSIYLEIILIDAFEKYNDFGKTFENKVLYAFDYIYKNIIDKKVVDPSNSTNIISDTLSLAEKQRIKQKTKEAIDAKYWSEVVHKR